jgi:hypothetical protein
MLHTRSICSLRFRFQAATVPTRWLLPRPDKGHRTARSGGSLGVAISCGLPFLARPPEVRVVTPHPVQDHDVLEFLHVGPPACERLAEEGDQEQGKQRDRQPMISQERIRLTSPLLNLTEQKPGIGILVRRTIKWTHRERPQDGSKDC